MTETMKKVLTCDECERRANLPDNVPFDFEWDGEKTIIRCPCGNVGHATTRYPVLESEVVTQ